MIRGRRALGSLGGICWQSRGDEVKLCGGPSRRGDGSSSKGPGWSRQGGGMSNPLSLSTTETFEFIGIRPAGQARPSIRVEFAATSHPGKVRSNNEDHFLVTRMGRTFEAVSTNMPDGALPELVDEVAYGMVVADGMGGMAAGEKASQLAIRTGVDLVLNSPMWATRVDQEVARQLIDRMRAYFHEVDNAVIGQANANRHLSGMGTTLTVAYIIDSTAFIVHVGDSRAYHFRKGKLYQITRDHTMAQDLLRAGAYPARGRPPPRPAACADQLRRRAVFRRPARGQHRPARGRRLAPALHRRPDRDGQGREDRPGPRIRPTHQRRRQDPHRPGPRGRRTRQRDGGPRPLRDPQRWVSEPP